jgi:hypothetical protein
MRLRRNCQLRACEGYGRVTAVTGGSIRTSHPHAVAPSSDNGALGDQAQQRDTQASLSAGKKGEAHFPPCTAASPDKR